MRTSFIIIAMIALAGSGCSTRQSVPRSAHPDAAWWREESAGANGASIVSMTKFAFERAMKTGDLDVAAAAEYNQLHVVAAAADDTKAQEALHALTVVGDDYSIAWLQNIENRKELAHRKQWYAEARTGIRQRLERDSIPDAQQIEARFLRAGVARLCNPLELTLPAFTAQWARERVKDTTFSADLVRFRRANLAKDGSPCPTDRIVRCLAATLAENLPVWRPMFQ